MIQHNPVRGHITATGKTIREQTAVIGSYGQPKTSQKMARIGMQEIHGECEIARRYIVNRLPNSRLRRSGRTIDRPTIVVAEISIDSCRGTVKPAYRLRKCPRAILERYMARN